MIRRFIPLVALAACTPMSGVEPPPAANGTRYGAVGTEPFWSLGIADGQMAFADAEGRTIAVAAPPARPSFNGERYVTPRLTLDITHVPCSDGMSDKTYPDTVRVTVDGRELKGCGESKPDNALEGRDWRVNAIGGESPGGPQPATLRFDGGRLTGTTGCNRLTASYTLSGDQVTIAAAATTRMACPGPAMAQEQRLTTALRGPLTLVRGKDGVMLANADGSAAVTLVPVRP
ncbi:META domain-containing protein [Sphingomonas sp. Y38-1Y]|uniref:META domain-containing protein n=1 Tax=Sphingomonas sp. Y38-1Y TaxID=3078265 RepID=UPI0028E91B7D|nr:META domain-containing protein [Sphingomonas sp. Y38-1Y]